MKLTGKLPKEERKAIFARKMNLLDLYFACMENAGTFINEAKILLQNQSFSRAAFLAYCGLEETGKAQIVADFYNGDLSEEKFRKYYTDHAIKAAYTERIVELSGRSLIEEGTMMPVTDQDADVPIVEQVWRIDKFAMRVDKKRGNSYRGSREPALYVEFDADFNPIHPGERVNRAAAEAETEKAVRVWEHISKMDAIAEGIGARGHFK